MSAKKATKASETTSPESLNEKAAEMMAAAQKIPGSGEDFGEDLVDRLKARHLPTGKAALEAGEIIKRRKLSFELDGVDCEPDIFVNEAGEYITFKVTMQSLTSAGEIAALRGARDAAMAPMLMAKAALHAINKKVLNDNEREFFWEALGPGGRQVALIAFQSLGAASDLALGKYLTTRSEE